MSDTMQSINQTLHIELFTVAGKTIHVSSLLFALLVIIGGWMLSRTLEWALQRALRKRISEHEGGVRATGRLLRYFVLAGTFAAALDVLGVDISSLFAAGAIFAVGIGFAMQNIAQNFVSGVILLVERSIKPGDILMVENRWVTVTNMGIRATKARTLDEEEIIIPNSSLVQASVTNYTLSDRTLRIRAQVGVHYGSDMQQVRAVLEGVGRAFTPQVEDRGPIVALMAFGSSSVDWEVSVFVPDPKDAYIQRSRLRENVWFALKEAGVTIAYPQLDVHFDEAVSPAPGMAA